jgi:hypothetical protein
MVSFAPQLLYPRERALWYPLDRRLGGPQSCSGHIYLLAVDGMLHRPSAFVIFFGMTWVDGFVWFRVATNGRLLRECWWFFGFCEGQGVS